MKIYLNAREGELVELGKWSIIRTSGEVYWDRGILREKEKRGARVERRENLY